MKHLLIIVLFLPMLLAGQEQKARPDANEGIKFEQSTWQQILAKAKASDKYIFVDVYATWCIPCVWMDENVYNQKVVGDFFNDKFISVKVQMDTTPRDNAQVRKWYRDAQAMMGEYKVTAFPTYLFFSPGGKIVHKDIGQKPVEQFIVLAKDALDPKKQFYRLLLEYEAGKRDTSVMKQLAYAKLREGDNALATRIAEDYLAILNEKQLFSKEIVSFMVPFSRSPKVQRITQDRKDYLEKLDESALLAEDHLFFITQFYGLLSSKDKFFKLMYHQPGKVDELLKNEGLSHRAVTYIIGKEEIDAKLWKDNAQQQPVTKQPDWDQITSTITKKYDHRYANALVPEARLSFYKRISNWEEFARLRDKKIKDNPPKAGLDLFDPNSDWALNGDAWDVFQNCDDKRILARALSWIELALDLDANDPQMTDTKANILYKLGRVEEAIVLEKKAIEMASATNEPFVDELKGYLEKMKKGEPTWPTGDKVQ